MRRQGSKERGQKREEAFLLSYIRILVISEFYLLYFVAQEALFGVFRKVHQEILAPKEMSVICSTANNVVSFTINTSDVVTLFILYCCSQI